MTYSILIKIVPQEFTFDASSEQEAKKRATENFYKFYPGVPIQSVRFYPGVPIQSVRAIEITI